MRDNKLELWQKSFSNLQQTNQDLIRNVQDLDSKLKMTVSQANNQIEELDTLIDNYETRFEEWENDKRWVRTFKENLKLRELNR